MGSQISNPLSPSNTPYDYNLGINYETWARSNILNDLSVITQNFSLIRTYHDMSVGTANPTIPAIDNSVSQVISYITQNQGPNGNNLELSMGTNESAVVQNISGSWVPGLMASSAYTDLWVKQITTAFGGTANTLQHLKSIVLGNELDQQGPPSTDIADFASYQTWINTAFANLTTSLSNAGLGSIPITTSIANFPTTETGNPIAWNTVKNIAASWQSTWNNGSPFILFDQYTQNDQQSTDFSYVQNYFNGLPASLTTINSAIEPFVGETGETSYAGGNYQGSSGQLTVYNAIKAWLQNQNNQPSGENIATIPLFYFNAFDVPWNGDPAQAHDGIYAESSTTGVPTGQLKASVVIPAWSNTPIGQVIPATMNLSSGASNYQSVYNLYQTVFNRGADPEGMSYWISQVNQGNKTLDSVSKAFLNSPEGASNHWATLSNVELITKAYLNTFGRNPDSAGQVFWDGQLNNGLTADAFVAAIASSQEAVQHVGIISSIQEPLLY